MRWKPRDQTTQIVFNQSICVYTSQISSFALLLSICKNGPHMKQQIPQEVYFDAYRVLNFTQSAVLSVTFMGFFFQYHLYFLRKVFFMGYLEKRQQRGRVGLREGKRKETKRGQTSWYPSSWPQKFPSQSNVSRLSMLEFCVPNDFLYAKVFKET